MINEILNLPNPGIEVYLQIAGEYFKLKLDDSSECEIKESFIAALRTRYCTEESEIVAFENWQEKPHQIIKFTPHEFSQQLIKWKQEMESISDSGFFQHDDDDFTGITAFAFCFGTASQKIIAYKRFAPSNLIHQGKRFWIIQEQEVFKKFEEPLLAITPDADFLQLGDDIYVSNIKILERFFGFSAIIEAKAKTVIDKIDAFNHLSERSEEKIKKSKYYRKLAQIRDFVIPDTIPNARIFEIAKSRFGLDIRDEKIILSNDIEVRKYIQLMSDSSVKSELTETLYIAEEKKRFEEEVAATA